MITLREEIENVKNVTDNANAIDNMTQKVKLRKVLQDTLWSKDLMGKVFITQCKFRHFTKTNVFSICLIGQKS